MHRSCAVTSQAMSPVHAHAILSRAYHMAGAAPWRKAPLATGINAHVASGGLSRPMVRLARLVSAMSTGTAQAGGAVSSAPAAAPPPDPAAESGYRLPPREIQEIVDAPTQPLLSFSPDRSLVLQLSRPSSNVPIAELARPELKLAGLRIDPDSHSRSRMSYYTGLAVAPFAEEVIFPLREGVGRPITGVPPGMLINYVTWSPGGKAVAFTLRSAGGPGDPPRAALELWVADVASGQARRLLERRLNTIFEDYFWVDDDTVVAALIPTGLGAPPEKPLVPTGPRIEDNSAGKRSQARTYQDLLQNEHDVQLFDHYALSELVSIKISSGEVLSLGPPRAYTASTPSPDGEFLLVAWLERPYSYTVPCGRFPKRVQLWTRDGRCVRELAALPLADDIPIAFDSCRKGPRGVEWRDDKACEVAWTECQDGGDPAVEVSPRDKVFVLDAAAAAADPGAAPRVIAGTDMRCGGVAWGDGDLALLYEAEWKTRRSRCWVIAPDSLDSAAPDLLWDRNYEDSYTDPGTPMLRRTTRRTSVLVQVDGQRKLLMQGGGASPEGNRPFLDTLDLDTKETKRLWQSSAPYYETVSSILSDENDRVITLDDLKMLSSRESVEEPPQYHIKTFTAGGAQVEECLLSDFPHPTPTLRGLSKQIVQYQRADGVDLNATLYLPPGYDQARDGPLPALLWAYPREFKSKAAAGQLRKSPYTFSAVGSSSPLLFLARGYAVLDGPGFPIVAEGDDEPNDTYVEQLTASARAAVEEVGRLGVVDTKRICVAGHSYGAFMTAGLLAHAPGLFACGIARSGAYNRTMTPFGFQAEERTIWQAPDTYMRMSPFMHADKIVDPLLLLHGEADNNPGTFTLQSERLYGAVKGHGGPCRLVILPHESHSYSARESVLHVLAEMADWMDRYCAKVEEI